MGKKSYAAGVLDETDQLLSKMQWQEFVAEQEKVLYNGSTELSWRPGIPMMPEPNPSVFSSQHRRPMVELLSATRFEMYALVFDEDGMVDLPTCSIFYDEFIAPDLFYHIDFAYYRCMKDDVIWGEAITSFGLQIAKNRCWFCGEWPSESYGF